MADSATGSHPSSANRRSSARMSARRPWSDCSSLTSASASYRMSPASWPSLSIARLRQMDSTRQRDGTAFRALVVERAVVTWRVVG